MPFRIPSPGRKRVLRLAGAAAATLLVVAGLDFCTLDEAHRTLRSRPRGAGVRVDFRGVLWPALGQPCELATSPETTQSELTIIVALPAGSGAPCTASARLRPVGCPECSAEEVSATLVASSPFEPLAGTGSGRWAPLIVGSGLALHRVVLRTDVPFVAGNRRMTVFDLEVEIDGERYSSPASVFVRGRDAGDLRLVLASDVHVATRWDEIEADVSRLFPPRAAPPRPSDAPDATFAPRDAWSRDCFLSSFVNPNRNLVALLKTVNRMAERGEIDAVFLVGDLVDYKYSRPRRESGDGFADSEWSLLERILLGTYPSAERLTVPLFTSTGNHDYRLYPYKLQIYGLRHCAIPDSLTTELLQRAGTRQGFAYRPEDLDALRIDTGPTHSLDFYHRHFSPLEDWALDLGGLRLVALDTGPDYFCDASHLRTARFLRFVRGLRSALDPYSNGFSDEQARFLDEALRAHPEGPALVLAHAPLMNAPGEGAAKPGGATRQLPAALGEPLRSSEEPAKRARRFEGLLSETELDEGVVFQNQLPVLEAMRRHPGPVMMASGHNHWHFEIGWDGAGGGFRIDPKASQGPLDRRPASEVLLYQGPALGHVKRNDLRTGIPSYTVVQADSKSLRSVELRRLRERPYDAWLYEWEATPASTRETRVRVQFESQRETAPDAPVSYHKVIFWESPPGSGSRATGRRAWRVKAPGDDVVSFRESGEEAGGAWTSFVVRDVPVATFLLEGRLGRPPLSLLFETFEVRVGAASSLGLRWHHRLLR